jgi:Glycosyltransferase family 87
VDRVESPAGGHWPSVEKRLSRTRRGARAVGLLAFALLVSFGALVVILLWPTDSRLSEKDFGQEYLLARAILDRADPYQPINQVAAAYVQVTGYFDKAHPTPHPPTVGFLALPLGLMDYPAAVRTWFILELACLVGSVVLLSRGADLSIKDRAALLIAVALVAWAPVTLEIGLGQLMLPVLLGLAGAQAALLRGRSTLAGALLGLTLLVKPIAWPWLLVLAWRRVWPAVGAAIGVGLVGGLITLMVLGSNVTADYLFRVLPMMSTVFFAESTNMSLWTVAPRLGAPSLAWLLPTVVLAGLIWWAGGRRDLREALGMSTIASLLGSPITWYFYLVLALLPLAHVAASVKRRGVRPQDLALTVAVFALLGVSQSILLEIAGAGAGASVLLLPTLALAMLAGLLALLAVSHT